MTEIKFAQQRLVIGREILGIMRTMHDAYAPLDEPFGRRLETLFIGMTLAIGQIEGKPFSVAKMAAYMHIPRTTVIRRLNRLKRWGLIERDGNRYFVHPHTLNSLIGMASYYRNRRILTATAEKLAILDAYDAKTIEPDARLGGG